MSDTSTQSTPHTPGSGGGLTHKVGPLPVWAWAAVIVGAYIAYRIIKDRQGASTTSDGTVTASNNANSLFGSEGFSVNSSGQVVDNATGDILGGSSGSSGTGSQGATTNSAWFTSAQQALFNLGYNSSLVDQSLQDYAAGVTLPQAEYNTIEAAIKLTGNPPSGTALPELQPPGPTPPPSPPTPSKSVAPSTAGATGPGPAPGLPGSLIAAMTGNGEHIVDTVYNQYSQTWLYLTNKGGVYSEGGNGFYGSIFALPSGTFAGRTAQTIVPTSDGGYSIVDTAGETYNFGPASTGRDYSGVSPGGSPY